MKRRGKVSLTDKQGSRPLYLHPNMLIIYSVTLMAVLGVSSITPAFPKIVNDLGISPRSVGLLITVFTLPGIFLTPVMGVLADRFGRKKILGPSLIFFAVAGTGCFFTREFETLLWMRLLQGVGAASIGAINVTLIGDLYSGRQRTAAMGYNSGVLSVGTAFYPVIGGAMATLEWYYPFILPVLALPVALLVLFSLNNPEPKSEGSLREYLRGTYTSVKDRRVISLFAAGIVTFVILFGAYLTNFPLLMWESFKISPFVIGLVMSTMSVSTALTSWKLGWLAGKFSEQTLLKTSYLFYASALVMIPLAPNLWTLIIPTALAGIANGINIPTIHSLLSELAPLEQRGVFMSINGMMLRVGQTSGPLLAGAALGVFGLGGSFFVGAALALVMLILIILL